MVYDDHATCHQPSLQVLQRLEEQPQKTEAIRKLEHVSDDIYGGPCYIKASTRSLQFLNILDQIGS
jgi:hypothetical protein